ncbi:MAG: ParB/RepB/Spo0J family partition protein [Bacilli bacterium]|jgi:ParB family chromosome partitioning protein|nr:ParB/RepB/Spo0J family partition protein [Bacilli bacterium]
MQNNENEVVYLYLDDIIPNRFQPRQVFDEKALKELAVSIKEHGVIQPIIVRNIGNKYEIIAGERRYKASALAGLTKIPAIVRNLDDKESSKVALLENLQRKNLNPIEEARTYQKILELDQMTQEELAKTMGKSQSAVANKLRLLSLSDDVQDALLKEKISERHARALLAVDNQEKQKQLLNKIIANKMTVRELEEEINPKPKEKIATADIEKLLNREPVSVNENTSVNVPSLSNLNLDNNNSVKVVPTSNSSVNTSMPNNSDIDIDYSTPPKFIDYGDEKIADIQDPLLKSTASSELNLDELRNNAQDINVKEEKPSMDMDSLLKVNPTGDVQPEQNMNSNFKFFQPDSDDSSVSGGQTSQASMPSNNNQSALDALLSSSVTPTNNTPTPDSLLNVNRGENQVEEKNEVPYLDTYNNPFAHNPIFSDDVEKIMGKKIEEGQEVPKLNFNDCLDVVRDAVKRIEQSGFKVESEEMNFEKNYQIVIKIAKNEE